MGWFKDTLKKGAELVGKAVGAVVSAVAEVGKAVVKGFSNANNRVQDFISLDETRQSVSAINTAGKNFARDFGSKSSYRRETATISQTKQIYDELGSFKNLATRESRNFENAFYRIGRDCIDDLTEGLMSDERDDFVASCKQDLDKINGTVVRELSSKISLDDRRCYEILTLSGGDEKERRMQEFVSNATKQAFKKLGDDFAQNLRANVASVIKNLQHKLDSQRQMSDKQLAFLRDYKEASSIEQKQNEQGKLALDLAKQIKLLSLIQGE